MKQASIHVPSMDAEIRWELTPGNWLTRILWSFIDSHINIQVQYIYMATPRQVKDDNHRNL